MDKIFQKFKENRSFHEEMKSFGKYLNNPLWEILPYMGTGMEEIGRTKVNECIKRSARNRNECRKDKARLIRCINKARRNETLEVFEYGNKRCGFCYPLVSEGKVFGFIISYEVKKNMSSSCGEVFSAFTDAVIREIRKEMELEEINNVDRPRAIALSTVHTVHRLITSTVELNELLPRIAMLSLQVLNANRCSIKLVDKKRKILLPKATIDLRKKKTKLKKVEIGKYAPGKAVKQGAPVRGKNYLAAPMIDEEVVGVITLYDKVDGGEFTQFDEEIIKTLSEQAAIAIRNAQLFKEQADLTLSSIRCIAHLLENRPHGAYKAEASFLRLIGLIGPRCNMNEREIKMLQYAAMLHDAGQISVPERVLMKRGGLTGSEYDIVKTHPLKGASILSRFRPLKPIVPIIMYHHENFDGTGYPKGLKGDDIPLSARILAVVGAFEAMITKKPYRRAMSINSAVKEVRKNSGIQFDPDIVKIFCEVVCRKDVRRLLKKELGKT